jgi:hypothetical protein
MSSKKKPRPLFEVPVDIETSQESGWVYRSEGHVAAHVESAGDDSGGSVLDTGSIALALGIAAIAQTMVLGLTIAAIPMTMGMRALQSCARD